ncbi:hypothetical protein K505DRAFT_385640 [Melanomma pulvis-pyrius CBS 109.77]|uniref:Uncharacterized protein n=1 Tax=Melanomma pulvis-pyrius CBS 109.77 TaxID=1314802 RepID=A0A6A6XAM8_9PLEO|nr:hypothetical protein K505DRAFT_385640 [Melanomma pulvis-pyrius CBS 109.77]
MGGTWVHWCQPHVYNELHRYGLHKNLKTSAGALPSAKAFFKARNDTVKALASDLNLISRRRWLPGFSVLME